MRKIAMKVLLLLAGNLCFAGVLLAQQTVKGYVFEDLNGNGNRDRREKGLANVSVSNGREVVQTDTRGAYTLPCGDDQIVFVIKPSGYKTALTDRNLPAFYYIHKPNGSPDLRYPGVRPTGPLPASVDFALTRQSEDKAFTTLVFGDPQAYSLEEVDFFNRGVVEELRGVKEVAFGISMGDLVGNNPDLFNPYIEAVQRIGVPWYNVIGNHDINFDASSDALSDESFEAHFGPANYAFNYGDVHFILLDNVFYPGAKDGKKVNYFAGFREEQLDFVENNLKFVPKDKLIVIGVHIPFVGRVKDQPVLRKPDAKRLFTLLKDFPHTLSISAHTHIQHQQFITRKQGWQQDKDHHHFNVGTTSGNWYSGEPDEQGIPAATMADGTRKGYAFIRFNGNSYEIDYKVAGKPADYRMEISVPKILERNKKTSAGIYVNYFLGGVKDTLYCRVGNGEWVQMNRVDEADPSFTYLTQRWDYTDTLLAGRRPGDAKICTHLWRAPVPVKLPPGTHEVEIKVKDMFGRTFTQKKSYIIAERRRD